MLAWSHFTARDEGRKRDAPFLNNNNRLVVNAVLVLIISSLNLTHFSGCRVSFVVWDLNWTLSTLPPLAVRPHATNRDLVTISVPLIIPGIHPALPDKERWNDWWWNRVVGTEIRTGLNSEGSCRVEFSVRTISRQRITPRSVWALIICRHRQE